MDILYVIISFEFIEYEFYLEGKLKTGSFYFALLFLKETGMGTSQIKHFILYLRSYFLWYYPLYYIFLFLN